MAIDLNQEWTNTDVSALLGSVADDRDWRLEVDKRGMAALHDKTAPTDAAYDQTLHCFFETWHQGTDFVGPSAASDKGLVAKRSGSANLHSAISGNSGHDAGL